MRTQIPPALFLAGAFAVSAGWLWLRPANEAAPFVVPSPGAATARPAARPSVAVDAAILRRYAGRYEVEGFALTISVDGDRLLVAGDGLAPLAMRASSETKFFFDGLPGEVTFDAGDPAKGFVADVADGRHRATRVGD